MTYEQLTLPRLKAVGFLDLPVHLTVGVSPQCQRWFCPQAFCFFAEASFRVPLGTVEKLKF